MSELTDIKIKSNQLEIPDNWETPKEIAQPIKEKTDEILSTLFDDKGQLKQDAPDTILVLQRSAQLPFELAREKITKNPNGKNINIVDLPVGKVIPLMYTSYLTEQTGDEDIEIDFVLNEDTRPEFTTWLRDTDIQSISLLREEIQNTLLNSSKILVVDDAESSGETVKYTLPSVLKASLEKDIPYQSITYFDGGLKWEYKLIDSLNMSLTPLERSVIKTFLTGSIDLRYVSEYIDSKYIPNERREYLKNLINSNINNGNVLLGMNSSDAFELAGYLSKMEISNLPIYKSIEEKNKDFESNVGLRILNRYGIEKLLDWRVSIIDRIKKDCEATAG